MLSGGSTITFSGTVRPCHLDERDELGLEQDGTAGGQKKRIMVARIKTSDFPDLKQNDEVTVDGIAYIARYLWKPEEFVDGAITDIVLRVS